MFRNVTIAVRILLAASFSSSAFGHQFAPGSHVVHHHDVDVSQAGVRPAKQRLAGESLVGSN